MACGYHGFRHTQVGQWIWRKNLIWGLFLASTSHVSFEKSFNFSVSVPSVIRWATKREHTVLWGINEKHTCERDLYVECYTISSIIFMTKFISNKAVAIGPNSRNNILKHHAVSMCLYTHLISQPSPSLHKLTKTHPPRLINAIRILRYGAFVFMNHTKNWQKVEMEAICYCKKPYYKLFSN